MKRERTTGRIVCPLLLLYVCVLVCKSVGMYQCRNVPTNLRIDISSDVQDSVIRQSIDKTVFVFCQHLLTARCPLSNSKCFRLLERRYVRQNMARCVSSNSIPFELLKSLGPDGEQSSLQSRAIMIRFRRHFFVLQNKISWRI